MKSTNFLTVLMFFAISSFAQEITRGPDIGEIYFLGPTHTGTGLYYSTDFGETAVCVDSLMNILTIAGDKTAGGVYCIEMPSNLYYSDNYGYSNSWIAKNSNTNYSIKSGRIEGEIYASFYKHSNDFGSNFIFHTCNGFFGNRIDNEIDNETDKGYILVYDPIIPDTIYLLFTDDNFENIQIQNNFFKGELIEAGLAIGSSLGGIYINMIRNSYLENLLLFSNDFGQTFDTIDRFNFIDSYTFDFEGGRQGGEIFILCNFVNLMWQNAHIYIYHSTNYGMSFEVYHPFSKGSEPVLANFSTIEKEVHLTTPVEFSNFSIGEIQEYQWDFDNDGTIDSFEEEPTYLFQDTGWYSVKLSAVGIDSTNSFTKENYIHIIDTTTLIDKEILQKFSISPNPINDEFYITYNDLLFSYSISIYNLNGEKVLEMYNQSDKSFTINTSGLNSGVYILNIVNQKKSTNYKIIKK